MNLEKNSFCSEQAVSIRFPKRRNSSVFGKADFAFQKGFTLLEMLVVSFILLVIAGGVVTSFRDVGSDASEQAARFQMQQLGEAIEAYYKDNGTFPSRETPADLSFLFEQTSEKDWDIDYRLGWRGPYLSGRKYLYLDIGDDLQASGASKSDPSAPGEPYEISGGGNELSVIAIADPFNHFPVDEGKSRSSSGCEGPEDTCLLEWRQASGADDTLLDRFGRPYLALDLEHLDSNVSDSGVARLVSMGANGIYEANSCDYSETDDTELDYCSDDLLCSSSGDDIVLCLR